MQRSLNNKQVDDIMETDNNWRLWCRLCAKADLKTNINIFLKDEEQEAKEVYDNAEEEHTVERNLVAAIERHFSINIQRNEERSNMLCLECFNLTTSLIKFSERAMKVQQMFDVLGKSLKECEFIDVQLIREKCKLLDTNRVHVSMKEALQEVHYLEQQTKFNACEERDCSTQANILDPLEVVQTEVKLEKQEYHADSDTHDTVEMENSPMSCCNNQLKESSGSEKSLNISVRSSKQLVTKPNKFRVKRHTKCQSKVHKKTRKPTLALRKSSRSDKQFIDNECEIDACYNCSECPRKFKRERDCHFHLKYTHNKDVSIKEFRCLQCPRVYTCRDRLRKHAKLHVPLELRKTFACHLCEQKFTCNFNVKSHIKIVHMNQRNNYVCEECGAVAYSKGALQSHLLIHAKTTPFACTICSKAFKSANYLKRHMEIHDAKVMCPECGLQLSSKSTLSRHMLVHSSEMKHKCEQCGRAFKTVKNLKRHLITHTGLKLYTCEFCNQAFASNSTCRLHKKKLHSKELAEQEASGAPKPYTHNIPKLATLRAMSKAAGAIQTMTSD